MATLLLLLLAQVVTALAYVPAQATNNSSAAQATGQNFSDASWLTVQWDSNTFVREPVSFELLAMDSLGTSEGVLVHFSEQQLPIGSTTTPWIALISCDANATIALPDVDIFTLAQERGAVGSLLYSLTSTTCQINPEYADSLGSNGTLDVYAIKSLSLSKSIESLFTEANVDSEDFAFNPAALNASAAAVQAALLNHNVSTPGLLLATLTAFNATTASPSNATVSPSNTTGLPSNTTGTATPSSQATLQPLKSDYNPGSLNLIEVGIGVAVVVCLCAIGLWQWWYRRRARRARGQNAPGPESSRGSAADAPAGVETREARFTSELGEGSAATASVLPAVSSGHRHVESSSRVTFSPDRLVRTTERQTDIEGLEVIYEVQR